MTVFRATPEIRCRIGPKTLIPTGGTGGFSFGYLLDSIVGTAGGTSSGVVAGLPLLNPLKSRSWNEPSQLKSIGAALEFVRFTKDGRVFFGSSAADAGGDDEICGFALRMVETPLDNRTAADAANTALLAGIDALLWTATGGAWRGVLSGGEGQARGLVNVGAQGSGAARSGKLSANQGVRWTVRSTGLAGANGVKALRLSVADNLFSVVLEHGKPPRFQERVGAEWAEAALLRGAPNIDLSSGVVTTVRFVRLCGRLLVGVQGQWWWIAKYRTAADAENRDARAMVEIAWPEATCAVEQYGVRCAVDLALIDFDGSADTADRQLVLDVGALNYPYQGDGEKGIASGWLKYGSATVDLTATENRGFATLTVGASADRNDTPLVNKISGKFPDSPFDAGSGTMLDVSNAVRAASLELPMPPFQMGSNMEITLDRMHLDRISAAWGDTIQQFCVVTWEARWRYTDNSAGPWTSFFKGIAANLQSSTSSVNSRMLTLTCFSPVYLLTAPAALIDHSHPPLDLFYLLKLRESNSQTSTGGPYNPYDPPPVGGLPQNVSQVGYTCVDVVRDIYYLFYAADASRVYDDTGGTTTPLLTSDNDPLGYARATQVAGGDSQPPSVSGFMLEPPVGSDAASWIQDTCAKVNAFVYEGYLRLDDFTDWPRPIVSTLERYYADRPTHIVSDTIFDGLSTTVVNKWLNRVADSIARETRPDVTLNHVIATSSGFYGDSADGSGLPGRIAEAYLSAGDFNSEANIRHRRSLMEDVGPLGGFIGGLEAYVLTLIDELEVDQELTWPTVTMEGRASSSAHGDKPIVNGDLLKLEFGSSIESDSGINLNRRTFRVASGTHQWSLGDSAKSWKFRCQMRPISGTGL